MISLPHSLRSASTTNVIRDSIQSMYVTGLSENKSSAAFCSAALIAPMWLLTLAECANASKWAAIGSNSSLGDDGTERIEVDRWVLQPNYTNSSGYQQLALLELKTASQYAPANISWNDNLPDNSTLWVRGFDTSTSDKSLVETTAKLWRYDECDQFYYDHQEYGRTLNESMQCLRDSQCQQERGSAVMVDVNGTSRLIGLTYWQSSNTTIAPAVYLPITSAKEFIQSTLQATTSANSSTYPPIGSTSMPSVTSPISTNPTSTIANHLTTPAPTQGTTPPKNPSPSATGPGSTDPNQLTPTGSIPRPAGPTPTGPSRTRPTPTGSVMSPSASGPASTKPNEPEPTASTNPNQPANTGSTPKPTGPIPTDPRPTGATPTGPTANPSATGPASTNVNSPASTGSTPQRTGTATPSSTGPDKPTSNPSTMSPSRSSSTVVATTRLPLTTMGPAWTTTKSPATTAPKPTTSPPESVTPIIFCGSGTNPPGGHTKC